MEKFKELMSKCKCSVSIEVNGHRDYYDSVEKHMEDVNAGSDTPVTTPEVLAEMIKRDTVVWVQAYPDTPIGFYVVYHYDIDLALDQMLECVKNNN